MSSVLVPLPPAQLAPLLARYRAAVAARRARGLALGAALVAALALACWVAEVDPVRLGTNIGRFTSYLGRIFTLENGRSVVTDPAEWFWGLGKWLRLIGDTLLIAYLGTLLGLVGAVALCFTASTNLGQRRWSRIAAKRFLEFARTVPELVFALIFVIAFGLGALPGVLALAIHSMGALGKLFAEAVENIDMGPVEGLRASGADGLGVVRFAALPQVLPTFASYALLRFEVNVRSASVMGFVGAGGIGQDLIEAVRKFYYSDVSAILVLIVLTVVLIDLGTERLRHRLIGDGR